MPVTTTSSTAFAVGLVHKIREIVDAVPTTFREVVRSNCMDAYQTALKLSHARHAVKGLESHKANGTFPTAIASISVPLCQVTKEGMDNMDVNTLREEVNSLTLSHRQSLLDTFIKIKRAEVSHIQGMVASRPSTLKAAIEKRYKELRELSSDSILDADYTSAMKYYPHLVQKASQLAYADHEAELARRMKKLEIKEETMKKVLDDTTSTAIREAVRIAMQTSQKRKNGPKNANKPLKTRNASFRKGLDGPKKGKKLNTKSRK